MEWRARKRKRDCRPRVDDFRNGARVGGNIVPTGEGFLPLDLFGEGDDIANRVDSSLTAKRVEQPPLIRGNAELSFNRDLRIFVSACPHLKPFVAAWPGGEGGGHPRQRKRRTGATIVVLRAAWLGGAAFGTLAFVSRMRGAAFEAQAPDAGRDAPGLSTETSVAV